MKSVAQQKLNSWDIEDDDIRNDESLQYDENTGLYRKILVVPDENDVDVRQILEYKLVTIEVSESVKCRKLWKKFGKARNDPPGPNIAQTYLGEEVFMKFLTDENVTVEEDKKVKDQSVKCRRCGGEHFSHKCPYKEEIENIQEIHARLEGLQAESSPSKEEKPKITEVIKPPNGRYMPPHLREDKRRSDSATTIRVSNLPEAAQEADLEDLFRPFGSLSRTFLAKDKQTGVSRGFAYITFHARQDAAKAIEGVNGFGYDHCILQVEWAKQ